MNEEQKNCPYCNKEYLEDPELGEGGEQIPIFGKGYAIEHGDIVSFIKKKDGKYYLGHDFTPDDGYFLRMEIHYCPICGRKLEA